GRTLLSAGLVDEARVELTRLVYALGAEAERGVPIVGIEPSCLFTLRDELGAVVKKGPIQAIAKQSLLFEEFLARESRRGELKLALRANGPRTAYLHVHGHQNALGTRPAVPAALQVLLLLRLLRFLRFLLVLVVLVERASGRSHRRPLLAADHRSAHAADDRALRLAVLLRLLLRRLILLGFRLVLGGASNRRHQKRGTRRRRDPPDPLRKTPHARTSPCLKRVHRRSAAQSRAAAKPARGWR